MNFSKLMKSTGIFRHIFLSILVLSFFLLAKNQALAATIREDWPGNGVLVEENVGSNPVHHQGKAVGTSDGGVIVVYRADDGRQIRAQKIDGDGNLLWGEDGVLIVVDYSFGRTLYPQYMIPDGSDGFILIYVQEPNTSDGEIFGVRFNNAGESQWTINFGDGLIANDFISDANGDHFLMYSSYRGHPGVGTNIFVQKFNTAGQELWTSGGINVSNISTGISGSSSAAMISDEAGGLVISWDDDRNIDNWSDAYAVHIDSSGNINWEDVPENNPPSILDDQSVTVQTVPETGGEVSRTEPTAILDDTVSGPSFDDNNALFISNFEAGYPTDNVVLGLVISYYSQDSGGGYHSVASVAYDDTMGYSENFGQLCGDQGNEYTTEIWALQAPIVEFGDVIVDFTGPVSDVIATAVTFDGVDNSVPIEFACSTDGWPPGSTDINVTVNSGSGYLVYGGATSYSDSGVNTLTPEMDIIEFNNQAQGLVVSSNGIKSGASSTTQMSWTGAVDYPWSVAAMSLAGLEDGGGGGGGGQYLVNLNGLATNGTVGETAVAVLATYRANGGEVITSVTDSATNSYVFQCKDSGNEYITEAWYLNSPEMTSTDITVEFSGAAEDVIVGAFSLDGVDTTNSVITSACAGEDWPPGSMNPEVSINSAEGDMILAAAVAFMGSGNSLTPQSGTMTEAWNVLTTNTLSAGGYQAGTGIETVGWTGTVEWPWSIAALSVPGVSEGGSPAPGNGKKIASFIPSPYVYGYSYPTKIIRDASGNYYVALEMLDAPGVNDAYTRIFIQKLDSDGNILWSADRGIEVFFNGEISYVADMYLHPADNNLYISVLDDSGTETYRQIVDPDTGALTYGLTGQLVNDEGERIYFHSTRIRGMMPDGTDNGYIRLWYKNGELRAQRYSNAGDPEWGSNGLLVSDKAGFSFIASAAGTSWGAYLIYAVEENEQTNLYVQSLQTYYQIEDLDESLDPKDDDLNSIRAGAEYGLKGDDQPVKLIGGGDGLAISEVATDFTEDRSWPEVRGDADAETFKSVSYRLSEAEGTAGTHSLYILKDDSYNSIYVCPDAQTLEDVSLDCQDGYSVSVDDPSVREIYFANNYYYVVDGLTGTGGQGFLDNSEPSSPTIIGTAEVINGGTISHNTPTFEFSLSDPDVSDQVKYQIQVSRNSDFTDLAINYISALASQGDSSFTAGQSAGSGNYLTNQSLTEGSYYWRVKAIDTYDQESSYSAANSGAVAFTIEYAEEAAVPESPDLGAGLDHKSYTRETRPSFKWYSQSHQGVTQYVLNIDNGDEGDFSVENIPSSGTIYETNTFISKYYNFLDLNNDNNIISLKTKSSSDWSNDDNDGELREGKRKWQITAFASGGLSASTERTLFVDRTAANLEWLQLNGIDFSSGLSTTNQTPTISGRINDPLKGDKLDNYVASGPKKVEIEINRLLDDDNYQPHSLTTLNLGDIYWSGGEQQDQIITDNNQQLADKHAHFTHQLSDPLAYGFYVVKVRTYDKVGNSKETSFNLEVKETLTASSDDISNEGSGTDESGDETSDTSAGDGNDQQTDEQSQDTVELEDWPGTSDDGDAAASDDQSDGSDDSDTAGPLTPEKAKQIISDIIDNISDQISNAISDIYQSVDTTANLIGSILPLPANSMLDFLTEGLRDVYIAWAKQLEKLDQSHTTIDDIRFNEIGPDYVVISWKTNHYSQSVVRIIDPDGEVREVALDDKFKFHKVRFDQLQPNTTYQLEISSTGQSQAKITGLSFTTTDGEIIYDQMDGGNWLSEWWHRFVWQVLTAWNMISLWWLLLLLLIATLAYKRTITGEKVKNTT